MAEAFFPDLELRLHHKQEVGIMRRRSNESRENKCQRNKRHIPHDELGGGGNGSGIQGPDVSAIAHLNARIRLQLPGELAVSHIDRDDGSRTASQQNVRKSSRRCTGIQSAAPFDRRSLVPEGVEAR